MRRGLRITFAVILLVIASLGCVDLALDWGKTGMVHASIEAIAILLCLLLLVLGWMHVERTVKVSEDDRLRTEQAFQDFKARNKDTLRQFHEAMCEQFARWGFTESESRVAEGLIRGYSLREIAARAGRSVKTVRNQSTAIYARAGMTGRADLAAFFLSDLMQDDSED
ncbi:MAG: helix-turn-helix transcriptional regulator [Leptospirales bacterium]|nr:helix-turn-helix transcriptional regulator [Leptospirales bacterium]